MTNGNIALLEFFKRLKVLSPTLGSGMQTARQENLTILLFSLFCDLIWSLPIFLQSNHTASLFRNIHFSYYSWWESQEVNIAYRLTKLNINKKSHNCHVIVNFFLKEDLTLSVLGLAYGLWKENLIWLVG